MLEPRDLTAVVLAGGRSTRMGSVDKLHEGFGTSDLLDHVLRSVAQCGHVVVVGPDIASEVPGLTTVREDPPGGGPAAALATGAAVATTDVLFAVGGDMPFAAELLVPLLSAAVPDESVDAWLFADETGVVQTLGGLYRTVALRAVTSAQGSLTNSSLRSLVAKLNVVVVPAPASATLGLMDVDTPAELTLARNAERQRNGGTAHA